MGPLRRAASKVAWIFLLRSRLYREFRRLLTSIPNPSGDAPSLLSTPSATRMSRAPSAGRVSLMKVWHST